MIVQEDKISLFTFSLFLNSTTHNQGDHCILVINASAAHPAVDIGNQALTVADETCAALAGQWQELGRRRFGLLAGDMRYGG